MDFRIKCRLPNAYKSMTSTSSAHLQLVLRQRQHLSAVKNRKLCGTALAEKGKLCGHVQQNLSNCAVNLKELCENCAVNDEDHWCATCNRSL